MAFECGPQIWLSCLNSTAATCKESDARYEGKMVILTPDPQTGLFTGEFVPKGGGTPQKLTGQCSNSSPHITVKRTDAGGETHDYTGAKSGNKNMKGKHKKSKTKAKARQPVVDDDEWM